MGNFVHLGKIPWAGGVSGVVYTGKLSWGILFCPPCQKHGAFGPPWQKSREIFFWLLYWESKRWSLYRFYLNWMITFSTSQACFTVNLSETKNPIFHSNVSLIICNGSLKLMFENQQYFSVQSLIIISGSLFE